MKVKNRFPFTILVALALLILSPLSVRADATNTTQGFPGSVQDSGTGAFVASADITVNISSTADCLGDVYTETFPDNVTSGVFSVLAGGGTPLNLNYGQDYWSCYGINNGTDSESFGPDRFTSGKGMIGPEDMNTTAAYEFENLTLNGYLFTDYMDNNGAAAITVDSTMDLGGYDLDAFDIAAANDLSCINDLDVGDDADIGGDLTVVGTIYGTVSGNNSMWTRAGTNLYPTNIGDFLGIGIVPTSHLHVYGGGGSPVAANFQADANQAVLISMQGDRSWTLVNDGSGVITPADYFSIYDGTAGASRLTIDTTGKLGIGTIAPSTRLDVQNDDVLVLQVARTAGAAGVSRRAAIGFTAADSVVDWKMGNDIATNGERKFSLFDNVEGQFRFAVDSSGNFSVDTNTLFVDAPNNRVGIGTTTPQNTLNVVGDGNFTGDLYAGSNIYAGNNLKVGYDTAATSIPRGFVGGGNGIVEIRGGTSANDTGVFMRRTDGQTGLELWNDGNTGGSYIDTRWYGSSINFRVDTANAGYLVPLVIKGATGEVEVAYNLSVAGETTLSGDLLHSGNITNPSNTTFGLFNNGTCVVLGDLKYVSEC